MHPPACLYSDRRVAEGYGTGPTGPSEGAVQGPGCRWNKNPGMEMWIEFGVTAGLTLVEGLLALRQLQIRTNLWVKRGEDEYIAGVCFGEAWRTVIH